MLMQKSRPRGKMTSLIPGIARPRALWLGWLLVWLLAGCDLGTISTVPAARCTETGTQCQLAGGPLGVCERTACAPGESPPCFQCTPQH
jgi:hypothetical protein